MADMQVFSEEALVKAIATQLEDATGLKGYAIFESDMQTPCAVPTLAPEWNAGFGGTVRSPIDCDILVMTMPGDYTTGAMGLFDYTAATGARSVKVALEADRTIGGLINDLRVIGPQSKHYERYDADGNIVLYGRYIRVQLFV